MSIFKKKNENKASSEKHYLTSKEIKEISKANAKIMKELEKKKYRDCDESEFITSMDDDRNILEIEDLHTYFFTDQGIVKAVNGVSFNIPKGSTVGIVGESGCGKSVTSMSIMRLLQGPTGQIYSGSIRFKSVDYKRDEHGNPIPIYKRKPNGKILFEDVLDKNGNPVLKKDGTPKRAPVQATNESGALLFATEERVYDIAEMPMSEIHRLRGRQISMIFQEPMTSLNPVFTIGNQLDEVVFIHTPGATKEMAKKRSLEMLELVGIAAPALHYRRTIRLGNGQVARH